MNSTKPLPRIAQFLQNISYGDAIGNNVLAIRDTLEKAGYDTEIFAETIDRRLEALGISGIRSVSEYNDDADILICHVSVGWDYMLTMNTLAGRKLFIWHNITPPHFSEAYGETRKASACEKGLNQVHAIRFTPSLCLADSSFNKADLERLGYLCPIHVLPILRAAEEAAAACDEALLSKYRDDGTVNILFTGRITPNKKQQDIIEAFYCYHRFYNPKSRLFLVGSGTSDPAYSKAVKEYPAAIGLDGVIFPGHVSDRQKAAYYSLADVFVCLSEHEGFCVPLLEAMQYRVPVIAYDSSAVAETMGDAGLLLKSKKPMVVAAAINRVMQDAQLRETLVANGQERLALFAPAKIAGKLLAEIAAFERYWKREKTIYFDVTVQRGIDRGTGVQRVEKEELRCFYKADGTYKTVPFYFDEDGRGLFECETGKQIQPHPGDIIYSADLSLKATAANTAWLDRYFRKEGVAVWFLAYDLIPIQFPETCTDKTVLVFSTWLHTAFRYSGIISISRATMQDIQNYLAAHPRLERNKNLRLTWSWIGCDFAGQAGPQKAEAAAPRQEADGPQQTVRLLMVSTVEPRKMYGQLVKAFSLLRGRNKPVRLDIVGREGWKVEETVALINDSPYLNSSLFWHKDGISDGELASLYQQADGVIVASRQEGFGLAVTEGAYYGKPLILRDIPVFREIAGDNAFYFSGYEPEALAAAMEQWIDLFRAGKAPSSAGIHLTTWQEHGEKLLAILTEKQSKKE